MNTETHRQLASDIWSICKRCKPPRELAVIEAEIKARQTGIVRLLGEVMA